ncbi:Nitrate import ATP-binding protein NrtD [Castellaniella defragrans]
MNMLDIDSLSKTYNDGANAVLAIDRISFGVKEGELICVVGPSGCGKTTLVRCLAGLLKPSKGNLALRGKPITGPAQELAVVFQEYSRSLMPWMTVKENLALPLRHKRLAAKQELALINNALESVGLAHCADRYPWQLSGGMQQRVAIARALAYGPQILLMDEPFASVDAQTRAELEDLMLRVRSEFGVTVLFITHDIDEAVYLGDRVVVLSAPPTTVREILDIDLPQPRDQVETKMLQRFVALRTHVFAEIVRPGKSPDPAGTEGAQATSRTAGAGCEMARATTSRESSGASISSSV